MSIFTAPFYIKSPFRIQEGMLSLRGLGFRLLREGRVFKEISSQLEKSQYYSHEELRQLQRERLRSILRHSYENVPYYRRLFKALHLTPGDFKDIPDLEKLPFITKEDVRKNPADFLAINANGFFTRKVFTGGTTGSPLKLYRDLYSINFENAVLGRQYRWAGCDTAGKKLVLRSSPVVPSAVTRPPFWRYDFFQNRLMVSAYHLSKKNIGCYAEEILKYRPSILETVPSAGYLMARLFDFKKMDVDLKYIFTSSEVLMPHQKVFMEDRFKAQIFDHYGTAERVTAIGMCEKGRYHIYPEYGITELLPLSGRKGYFEIAGTTLNNFAMPLLRYKTQDVLRLSSQGCPCGRNFQTVEQIDGRKTDGFFITKDGRFVSLLSGILSIDLRNLIETQFIQEGPASMRIKVVADKEYSFRDELRLKKSIRDYLGNDVRITVEKVEAIPRTPNGKFKQFIPGGYKNEMLRCGL